jgi:lactoylglutathione lyase
MNALRVMIAALVTLAFVGSAQAQKEDSNELSIAAIRLGVTNLDASTDFYTKHLGCAIAGDHREHNYIMLENNGVYLVLTPADSPVSIGEGMCHSRINFEVKDLNASIAAMKAGGVRFVDENRKSAVGRFATFLDPSGNQHNIKQLDQQEETIASPRIYDIGISVTDMKQATDFYVEKLGFEELTRKYYPPVVPMKPRGPTFFILSEDAKHTAPYDYSRKAMTGLAFYTGDLEATIARLRAQGVTVIHDQPQHAGNVIFAAFKDPFGNVHEVMSYDDSPPSEEQPAAEAQPAKSKFTIEQLGWLAGTWKSSLRTSELREMWSQPQSGAMMGMFQWPRDGKSWLWEFMTLEQEEEGIIFRLRHFDPKLTPWEKEGPLMYPLAKLNGQEAIFENPDVAADHPRRIVYRRQNDTLTVRLEPADAQEQVHEFKFELVQE